MESCSAEFKVSEATNLKRGMEPMEAEAGLSFEDCRMEEPFCRDKFNISGAIEILFVSKGSSTISLTVLLFCWLLLGGKLKAEEADWRSSTCVDTIAYNLLGLNSRNLQI